MLATDRRTFTFASLGLALATAARAQAPNEPPAAAGPSPTPVAARWALARSGRDVVATLTLANTGAEPIEVLSAIGSRPGPSVVAYLEIDGDDLELPQVTAPPDRRELISRMGPRPQWAPIAAGEQLAIPAYTFSLPRGAATGALTLVATVETHAGEFELRVSGQTWETRSAS